MKLAVNGKIYTIRSGGERYIAGSGVKIEDSVISVTHPNVPLTQAEYDALSPEEKANGSIYIITDQELQANGDIYSLEEKRIGTWIDGKPLYRKVYENLTMPGSSEFGIELADLSSLNIDTVALIRGIVKVTNGAFIPAPAWSASWYVALQIANDNGRYYIHGKGSGVVLNAPCDVIFEFTKTTDSPEEVTTDGT